MSSQQVVVFDVQEFLSRYPEFAGKFTDEQLQNFFDMATGILNDSYSTPVCDYDLLKTMLYLLTAHIAFLFGRGAGTAGNLSSASEGSVSASFTMLQNLQAQWFNQSQYGQLFWQMSLPYRLGRYIPACGC
jgi:hypothetical protein